MAALSVESHVFDAAWHPLHGNLFACATIAGSVDIFDTSLSS